MTEVYLSNLYPGTVTVTVTTPLGGKILPLTVPPF